jgi:hypothetical protein
MPVVTSANRARWMMEEMARRSGKKPAPQEKSNPYEGMDKAQLKEQKAMLKEALKSLEPEDKE